MKFFIFVATVTLVIFQTVIATEEIEQTQGDSNSTSIRSLGNAECKDIRTDCPRYVQKGYCKNMYKPWMDRNCRLSCRFCNPSTKNPIIIEAHQPPKKEEKCKDSKWNCASYVRKGYCTKQYTMFMRKHCKLSCGYCKRSVPTPVPRQPTCEDKQSNCPVLANKASCRQTMMQNNCRKSCGFCKTKACVDIQPKSKCDFFQKKKYCVAKHVTYMKKNCPSTCGFCDQPADTNDCLSNPCKNGGVCIDGVNSYWCKYWPYWLQRCQL